MQYRSPAGAPIDITGFAIAATVASVWTDARVPMNVAIVDAANGRFEASLDTVPESLPEGQRSRLLLRFDEPGGEGRDAEAPVVIVVR